MVMLDLSANVEVEVPVGAYFARIVSARYIKKIDDERENYMLNFRLYSTIDEQIYSLTQFYTILYYKPPADGRLQTRAEIRASAAVSEPARRGRADLAKILLACGFTHMRFEEQDLLERVFSAYVDKKPGFPNKENLVTFIKLASPLQEREAALLKEKMKAEIVERQEEEEDPFGTIQQDGCPF